MKIGTHLDINKNKGDSPHKVWNTTIRKPLQKGEYAMSALVLPPFSTFHIFKMDKCVFFWLSSCQILK
jgi:hypothetical protein